MFLPLSHTISQNIVFPSWMKQQYTAMTERRTKVRTAKAPMLTRTEILTQGLMEDPEKSKAKFTLKTEDNKGRGVYLKIPELPKGSFVLEYEGDIITPKEALRREAFYASNKEGCFIMDFKYKGKKMAIDATRRFYSYTRLLNHSRDPNIKFHSPLVVDFSGPPRIAAYALRDIKKGEEIVFDYGIKDRAIPWLKNRQTGFAEVSDAESDEEDGDDADRGSNSSEDGYVCLRPTAARAGRLAEPGEQPAFNYRERSTSVSSGSETSTSKSGRQHRKTKRRKGSPQVKLTPCSPERSKILPNNSETQDLHVPGEAMRPVECGFKFVKTAHGGFQLAHQGIGTPQKILKSLEEPKRRRAKTNDSASGSVICLSDVSSQEIVSSDISDSGEQSKSWVGKLPDIPEVSPEKKVMDWQSTASGEDNLTIKIVGVQSLSDSPEHVPYNEPLYHGINQANSSAAQGDSLQEATALPVSTSGPSSSNPAWIQTPLNASVSQQLPHTLQNVPSHTQEISFEPSSTPPSVSSPHLSNTMQQPLNRNEGVPLQSQQCSSKVHQQSLPVQPIQRDYSISTPPADSNEVISPVDSQPLPDESPITFSDSEDQQPIILVASQKSKEFPAALQKPNSELYTALKPEDSISCAHDSDDISIVSAVGLTNKYTSTSVKPKESSATNTSVALSKPVTTNRPVTPNKPVIPNKSLTSNKPCTVNEPVMSQNTLHPPSHHSLNSPKETCVFQANYDSSQVGNTQFDSFEVENVCFAQDQRKNNQNKPVLPPRRNPTPQTCGSNWSPTPNTLQQRQKNVNNPPPIQQQQMDVSYSSSNKFLQHNVPSLSTKKHSLQPSSSKGIHQLQKHSTQASPDRMPKQSQNHDSYSPQNKMTHYHVPDHSRYQQQNQASQPPGNKILQQQQNRVSHPPMTTYQDQRKHMLPQNSKTQHPTHVSNLPPDSIPYSYKNQRPLSSHQKPTPRPSHTQPESLVISDDEDAVIVKAVCSGGSAVTKSTHLKVSNSKELDTLVVSSGDESDDVQIVPPKAAQVHSTRKAGNEAGCAIVLEECPSSHEQASPPKKVAVIKPYQSEDRADLESQVPPDSSLTDSEKRHLSKIFDRHIFSTSVSEQDIHDTIYQNWNFFKAIIERGISIDQIKSAVKLFFQNF